MASLSTVLETVYQGVIAAVYPNGLLEPSVAGVGVNIVKGWPIRNKLDEQMLAGKAMVSIYPTNKERVVTKFFRDYQEVSIADATLTATVVDNTVTIGGTVTVPQAVMVIADGIGYAYQVLDTDTIEIIAAELADLIPGASAVDEVITIDPVHSLIARITTQGTAAQELGRSEREFMISCWCPTPAIRDLLSPPIDDYFRINYLPVFSDGFRGMIFYNKIEWSDELQVTNIYRCDLFFNVQYAITNTKNYFTITHTPTNITFEDEI